MSCPCSPQTSLWGGFRALASGRGMQLQNGCPHAASPHRKSGARQPQLIPALCLQIFGAAWPGRCLGWCRCGCEWLTGHPAMWQWACTSCMQGKHTLARSSHSYLSRCPRPAIMGLCHFTLRPPRMLQSFLRVVSTEQLCFPHRRGPFLPHAAAPQEVFGRPKLHGGSADLQAR